MFSRIVRGEQVDPLVFHLRRPFLQGFQRNKREDDSPDLRIALRSLFFLGRSSSAMRTYLAAGSSILALGRARRLLELLGGARLMPKADF